MFRAVLLGWPQHHGERPERPGGADHVGRLLVVVGEHHDAREEGQGAEHGTSDAEWHLRVPHDAAVHRGPASAAQSANLATGDPCLRFAEVRRREYLRVQGKMGLR